VHDPVADSAEAFQEYGVVLRAWDALPQADAIVVAVAHRAVLARPMADWVAKLKPGGCFVDVKARFDAAALAAAGLHVWRL
jgi:UDP-N-acetyl-D-galactosamine dehydrogenase